MPLVVSDTSPLRALNHLGLVPLLADLFGDVVVPPAVAGELALGSKTLAAVDLVLFPFIRVVDPPRPLQVPAQALASTPARPSRSCSPWNSTRMNC